MQYGNPRSIQCQDSLGFRRLDEPGLLVTRIVFSYSLVCDIFFSPITGIPSGTEFRYLDWDSLKSHEDLALEAYDLFSRR